MHDDPHTWAELWLALPLFRDPIVCAVVAGAVLGFLGIYVVLRRMVFVSAAITQSAGLGVALAFYAEIFLGLHVDPVLGAAALALTATLVLVPDPQKLHLTRESVLGLVFAASGGAAVLVGSRIAQEAHDIQAILFGTAVLVRPLDLAMVLAVGGVVLLLHLWWYRGLTFASFDPVSARVQRLPVRLLTVVVYLSIGLMVGVAARALGALPVFAFTTLPAVAALLVVGRLHLAFLIAAAVGAVSGVLGYAAAFFWDLPVGAAQTTAAVVAVGAAALINLARRLARPGGRG